MDVDFCTHAVNESGSRGFFVGLASVFAVFIVFDSCVAALVIRNKMK